MYFKYGYLLEKLKFHNSVHVVDSVYLGLF